LLDSLQLVANLQHTDALQHTSQDRISYSFIKPMDPSSYSGSRALRDTAFEFNQKTRALNLNLRKDHAGTTVSHSLAYGFNYDETDTERPRNRCEEELASGASTCAIASYPFAAPEVFPNKTFPDSITTRFGLYLQNEVRLGDSGLTLIPGIRYDRYELEPRPDALLDGTGEIEGYGFLVSTVEENQTSLSLGAIYDFDEIYSVFAQYAEGYRPPNFDESNQAFVNLGHRYATVPNPALQAESSQGIEVGLRADFARAFISLAVYNNQYEDFIESNFVGMSNGISLFQDQNIGAVEIRGLEASANVTLTSNWQLRASLAYARGDNESDNSALDSVEPLTTVLGLAYDQANGRWGGELLLTVVAKKDRVSGADRVTADAYSVTDAVAWVNLAESATLRLGLFNLLDEQYARWANIQGLAATATDNIANAQQPGRNFRLSLDLEF
jgi:hemoglobin/transferrin/lactoferrin receptor protein